MNKITPNLTTKTQFLVIILRSVLKFEISFVEKIKTTEKGMDLGCSGHFIKHLLSTQYSSPSELILNFVLQYIDIPASFGSSSVNVLANIPRAEIQQNIGQT